MILLRKAVRTMLRHKRAYLSCILLMAIGVWTYATMNTALKEIDYGKDIYYEDYRLGDGFASVESIPKTALSKLSQIQGIKQVDGRLIETSRVMMPDNKEDVFTLKVISTIPSERNQRLNGYVLTGEDLLAFNDLLLGADFYSANGFDIGDQITLIINHRTNTFTVKGSVLSPEYVYIVENPRELFSDTTKYNIAYVDENLLMTMLGMEGRYNDLSFALEEGYDFDDVKDQLEYELKKYGLLALYERDELLSYVMMEEEIDGGQSMSTTFPMSFVIMAAVVLYLMLRRIIEQERTQIGTLKAMGYSEGQVLAHYLFYGIVTGSLGALLGLVISYFSISPYMDIYLEYYKLPISNQVANYDYYYIGGLGSILGGALGAYFGARSIVHLTPAEAMRPKAPKPIKGDITNSIKIFKVLLTSRGYMAVRNILRNKVRSSFVIIGIVFSFSMLVITGMMGDLMASMFTNQFRHVLNYDAEISLVREVPYHEAVQGAMDIEQIEYAEGVLEIPVVLYKDYNKTGVALIGLKRDAQLYKLYDDDRHVNIPVPKDGLVITGSIAKKLAVKKGDYIYLSTDQLKEDIKLYVEDVATQAIGMGAYIDLDKLSDLLDQEVLVNSILFKSTGTSEVREALLNSDQVTKVEDKVKTLEFYEELLGSYDVMMVVMQVLSVVIGFTIIYNTAVISMSERSREYATLRVLGLTIGEVREIMSFEYWILCFFGILAGIPFARFLNNALVNMMDIDQFSWPTSIPNTAFIVAALGCMAAVLFSNLSTVRAIKRLDLVEVLKERE